MGRMVYLIDGHNLIPHIPGLSLRAMDDEVRLVELLQVFSRVRRSAVEVFFDGAPPGQAGTRRYGTVKAHFVRAGRTADDAIVAHLRILGARAAQVSVVSSDHRVQVEARSLRASLIESGSFARDLLEAQVAAQPGRADSREASLGAEEVDEWLKLFNNRKKSE